MAQTVWHKKYEMLAAFWLERFWILGLYLTLWFPFVSRIYRITIVLLIAICNLLYLSSEIEMWFLGLNQGEESGSVKSWAKKDSCAFFMERVGMVMLMVGWWLQTSGGIIMNYVLVVIPVAIIFPYTNFMYTPWFPFLQEEAKKIQKVNQTETKPSSEKHHESINDRKPQTQSNGESKHDDHSRGSHVHVLETKQPPHESNQDLYMERTAVVRGNEESCHGEENSEFDMYKRISEREANCKKKLKTKLEEPKRTQEKHPNEAMPSSEQHHESIDETKLQSQSNGQKPKHDDQTRGSHIKVLESKQPTQESNEHLPKEKTAEVHGNDGSNHDKENSKIDRNNCTSLQSSFKEELSKPDYPPPHEVTKTEHERTEFLHGTALEITFEMVYGKDLSDADLSYLKLIKEVEESWERKLKKKQEKLKKTREENEKLREEKTSLASALFNVKAEAALYYQVAQSNGYHYNKLMEEKNDLAAKLCEATASSEVYRSLLHNFGASV